MTQTNRSGFAGACHCAVFPSVVFFLVSVASGTLMAERPSIPKEDWPWWRGHHQDGIAVSDQQPPLHWSETENVRWRVPVEGRGHGSPTVFGGQVLLATADPEKQEQAVVSVDRADGRMTWRTVIHSGGFANKSRNNQQQGVPRILFGGDRWQRLFVNFMNSNALWTTALDLNGKSSGRSEFPTMFCIRGMERHRIFGDLVIVSADNKSGGLLAGLNRETGDTIWQRSRPPKNVLHR